MEGGVCIWGRNKSDREVKSRHNRELNICGYRYVNSSTMRGDILLADGLQGGERQKKMKKDLSL